MVANQFNGQVVNSLRSESIKINKSDVQTWLINYLAELMEVDPHSIDIDVPFESFGLDSSLAIGLTGDLEDWLGKKLDPTLLYNYPTIDKLTQHVLQL